MNNEYIFIEDSAAIYIPITEELQKVTQQLYKNATTLHLYCLYNMNYDNTIDLNFDKVYEVCKNSKSSFYRMRKILIELNIISKISKNIYIFNDNFGFKDSQKCQKFDNSVLFTKLYV
ncbi:MAG TPA: hypothetical protein PKD00_03350 [Burkholderiales bacterium]|nr:hypothetical protein [Burkholderiales bacterium]